jgi:hypothetical protein
VSDKDRRAVYERGPWLLLTASVKHASEHCVPDLQRERAELQRVWDEWSADALPKHGREKYNPDENLKVWDSLKGHSERDRTICSLLHDAKEADWDPTSWQKKGEAALAKHRQAELAKGMAILAERAAARGLAVPASDGEEGGDDYVDPTSTEALRRAKVKPRPHMLENLVGPSLTYFVGDPKAGKSFLAMQMADAIGRGAELLGCKAPAKHRVLYYAAENGRDVTVTRIQQMDLSGDVRWRWEGGPGLEARPESVDELLAMR